MSDRKDGKKANGRGGDCVQNADSGRRRHFAPAPGRIIMFDKARHKLQGRARRPDGTPRKDGQMATRKSGSGGNKKGSDTRSRKSTSSKRSTGTNASLKQVTNNVPLRQPKASDSAGYKVLYVIVMLVIVAGVFAWHGGYLDRFLIGTPLEQYATTNTNGNSGNAGSTSGKPTESGSDAGSTTGSGNVITTPGAIDPNTLDTTWSVERAPDYYEILDPNDAHIDFEVAKGEFVYGGFDELGRTTRVYGCPTHETWADSAGWRAPMPSSADKISTWGATQNKPIVLYNSDGSEYKSNPWNRSHLIGDALGASTVPENLIKASRQQNTGQSDNKGGMRATEAPAEEYLKTHENGYVYYSATPIYKGDELMARAVYVQVQSDDKSLNEAVLVFNAAYGYEFNYADGTYTHVGI